MAHPILSHFIFIRLALSHVLHFPVLRLVIIYLHNYILSSIVLLLVAFRFVPFPLFTVLLYLSFLHFITLPIGSSSLRHFIDFSYISLSIYVFFFIFLLSPSVPLSQSSSLYSFHHSAHEREERDTVVAICGGGCLFKLKGWGNQSQLRVKFRYVRTPSISSTKITGFFRTHSYTLSIFHLFPDLPLSLNYLHCYRLPGL